LRRFTYFQCENRRLLIETQSTGEKREAGLGKFSPVLTPEFVKLRAHAGRATHSAKTEAKKRFGKNIQI
jgi:hypothetical protein